jgi:hypothetical protein
MHALSVDFRAAGKVLSVLPEREKTVGDFAAALKQSQANSADRAMADKWTVAAEAADRAAERAAIRAAERPAGESNAANDETADDGEADHSHASGREFGLSHHPLLAQFDLTPEDVAGGGLLLGEWRRAGDPLEAGQPSTETLADLLAALSESLNQITTLAPGQAGGVANPEGAPMTPKPNTSIVLGQILTGLLQSQNGASLAALPLAELPKDILAKLQSLLAANSSAAATPGAQAAAQAAGSPAAVPAGNAMAAQLMQMLRDQGFKIDVTQQKNWTSHPSIGGTLFTASQIASAGFGAANGGADTNFLGQGSGNPPFSGASLPDAAPGAPALGAGALGAGAAATSGQTSADSFHGNLLALIGADPAAAPLRGIAQLQASSAFDGPRIPGAAPEGVANQISVHIQRAILDGQDRIRIRLNPVELGRIDVKLELGHDGRLQAAIGAERHETLELLQRDARTLERALQDAGFKTDQQNFSFDLGFAKREQTAWQAGTTPHAGNQPDAGPDAHTDQTTPRIPRPRHDGAIDIQA